MDLDLSGRHALVCGASEGIGLAAARELALLGADVTLLARREDALRAACASLSKREGQRHDFVVADAAHTDALAKTATELAAKHPVHILVNNTGGPPAGAAHSADIAAYLDAFTHHLVANQVLVQALLPGMREVRWGRIVNVISTSVYEPIANLGVSNTVRGAVASWAKTLSKELGQDSITVNNVLPGYTETARIAQIVQGAMARSGKDEAEVRAELASHVPLRRFAQPCEIGGVIAFLCSPAAGYVSGQSIAVDGGRMHSI
ncbi:MAG: SDR family oxidoreductase [Thermomonas sp.]